MSCYEIKKSGTTFTVGHFPWVKDYPATPVTKVTLSYNEESFLVHFVSYETNLRATETAHNTPVHKDSCMEIFMCFDPEHDGRYINVEINPNCAAYSAVSLCREQSRLIDPADIDTLCIKSAVFDDRWELDYQIPVSYIQKQIPTYRHGPGARLRGNFYKCGDETDHPHFGCFSDIAWPHPDFHRPEFFADFVLV